MEYNRFDADPSTAGGQNPHFRGQEFSRLTGHLTLAEANQNQQRNPGEARQVPIVRAPESIINAALGGQAEAGTDADVKKYRSTWHSYEVASKTGQVIDQRASMGQAFLNELKPEQMVPTAGQAQSSDDDSVAQPVRHVFQSSGATLPVQSTVGTGVQPPIIRPEQLGTPVPQTAQFGASVPVISKHQPSAQFPTRPYVSSIATASSVTEEPLLTAGPAMHSDAQHLLPAPQHKILRVVKSPWFWLVFGIALIFYFAR